MSNERTVRLPSGVSVRTWDVGEGPPILLLHGNPDNADEYEDVIGRLRDGHRCLAPDLPGYGPIGKTYRLPASFDYSVGAQVRFVDEYLDAMGVAEKVLLVVHDIGGIMGVPWAAASPQRVRAVLYTNTVAFPFKWFAFAKIWGGDGMLGRQMAKAFNWSMGIMGGSNFRRGFGAQHPLLNAAQLDRFVENFALNPIAKETSTVQFRRAVRPGYFDAYPEMLRTIAARVPTATVWGDDDPYVATSYADQLLAKRKTILPKRGHWVPILAVDEVVAEVRKLDAEVAAGSGPRDSERRES
jgi:haloalkane dehalogenase